MVKMTIVDYNFSLIAYCMFEFVGLKPQKSYSYNKNKISCHPTKNRMEKFSRLWFGFTLRVKNCIYIVLCI